MNTVETRTAERESLFLFAEIGAGDGETDRIKVRNLSTRGMMAVCEQPPLEGALAEITLPKVGSVSGRCVWSRGQRFGFAFDREIEPRLTRQQLVHEEAEVPRYARSASFARFHGTRFGEKRPV